MYIPLLSLTALFGATQGLLLAIILLFLHRGNHLANRLLAGFLFAESLRLSILMFTYGEWVLSTPWLYLLLNITYAIGPLLYGYTRAMTQPDFKLDWRYCWHFSPIIIASLICSVIFYAHDFSNIDPQHPELSQAFWWGLIMSICGFLSLLIYASLALGLLKPYQQLITEQFSNIEKINLQWLRLLIYFCLVTAIISIGIELTRLSTDLDLGPRILASLLLSVLMIYGIGIMGIRQPAILGTGEWQLTPDLSSDTDNSNQTENITTNERSPQGSHPEKYLKSGLSKEESQIFWDKLQRHMDLQKPYLENGLKLNELAEQMDLLPNHLSQVINTHAGKSFFDFVNSYRVEAAKKLLIDDNKQHLAVASIAMDAGFNSQNTFYNQFKKHTGTTPSKYKKSKLQIKD